MQKGKQKGKGSISQKRKVVLVLFTICLTIGVYFVGFYLGSRNTALAKNMEMANKVEKVKKELKRKQTKEDKSPPLKSEQKKSESVQLKLMETLEPTAISKPEPTETQESTATPTLEPTETSEPTATPTLELTETSEPTATPTLEPMETSEPKPEPMETQEPTATSKPELTKTPEPMQEPITVKVIADTKMFKDKEGKRVVEKLKAGESLTVIENENGLLKVSHNDKEGFVKYIFTDFLDRMGISKPVVISELPDQIATVCKDGVQLRTKPGFGGDTVRTLEYGEKVIIHTEERMFLGEENASYKITVENSNEEGYVYDDDSLDWEMEFILWRGNSCVTDDKWSTESVDKNFGEDSITVKVCRPMNLYSGNTTKAKIIKHLQPGEELIVKLCTEAKSGWLMALYNDGPKKILLGYGQYLNTDYLDKVRQYNEVYKKELGGMRAVINTDSVNLRSRPGITRKSKVLGNAGKGTSLILLEYVEAVRYEKYGWFKAKVEGTEDVIYIYGKYVDMKNKKDEEKLKSLKEESAMTVEEYESKETGNSVEKGNGESVVSEMATKSIMCFAGTLSFKHLGMCA